MATNMNIKVLQVVKTTSQWESVDTVISKGLICVEETTDGRTLIKVGDGLKTFAELPYLTTPVMTGATSNTAGKSGLVPTPTANSQDKYLAGDGTWKDLTNGALYKVEAGPKDTNGATDKLRVYKSVDGGSTWTLIGENGQAAQSGATYTTSLGLFSSTTGGSDEAGKIKSSLLPSFVDDVVNGYYYEKDFYLTRTGNTGNYSYSDKVTPASDTIYVDISSNTSYRWNGASGASSDYISISNPISAELIYELTNTGTNGNFDNSHHGMVPASGTSAGDGLKVLRGDGWATLSGDSVGISMDTSTANTTKVTLNKATSSTIGGVKPGTGLQVDADGAITLANTGVSASGTKKVSKISYNAKGQITDSDQLDITDNASATSLSSASTNLITERSVANAGFIGGAQYTTSSGTVADIGLVSGTNKLDLTDIVINCIL